MDEHVRIFHKEFATPGWPAHPGYHKEHAGEDGWRLEANFAALINFGEQEELRIGVSASPLWTGIGIARNYLGKRGRPEDEALISERKKRPRVGL